MYSLQKWFTSNIFITKVIYKIDYPSTTLIQARLIAELKLECSSTNTRVANNKNKLILYRGIARADPRGNLRRQLNLDKFSQYCSLHQVVQRKNVGDEE